MWRWWFGKNIQLTQERRDDKVLIRLTRTSFELLIKLLTWSR